LTDGKADVWTHWQKFREQMYKISQSYNTNTHIDGRFTAMTEVNPR